LRFVHYYSISETLGPKVRHLLIIRLNTHLPSDRIF
jgi:hypothetical protein